jgi:RNA polymerase primary sigma factor
MSIQGVWKLLSCRRPTVSLDQPVSEDSGLTLGDQLAADHRDTDPETIIDRDYAEHLRRMIGALHPRRRMVLNLRFGLSGNDPMTFREVGDRLGLSRERVRQIEQQALSRLRQWLSSGTDPVRATTGS